MQPTDRRAIVWGAAFAVLAASASALADSVVDPGAARRPRAKAAAEVAYVGDHGHVAVFDVAGELDRNLPDGSLNIEPRREIARAFYAEHPDTYDFLIVFSTFEFDTGTATAFHVAAQSSVLGIARPLFDHSDLYGSDGRLQGYVDMAAISRYEMESLRPGFDSTLSTLAHEVMHQWGVTFEGLLGDRLLTTDRAHWSFLVDSGASVMYGNDWVDRGDGTFLSAATRKFFSPVELYLAGFYEAEEVPPFVVVEATGVDPDRLPEQGAVVSGTARTVTIEDVVAANGPRVPAAGESQRDFRAAFLLVKRPGEPIDPRHLRGLERIRDGIQTRFSILTGGRAFLEVFPEAPSELEPDGPGAVEGDGPRAGDASIADGLAWLRAEQAAEGYWEDTPATRLRDTPVAAGVLHAFDPAFTGGAQAASWIGSQPESNLDFVARSSIFLERLGADASARQARLVALQNADGGWGLGNGRRSDALDTALAVLALAGRADVPALAVERGITFLVAAQRGDGSWGGHPGGPGRTGITAAAARALLATEGVPADKIDAALAWLATKQNPDGGFGDSPSTAHDTAEVLLAVAAASRDGSVDRGAAVAFLRGRQTEAGSWEGSRHTTARVIEALRRSDEAPNWRLSGSLVATPAVPRDGDRVRLEVEIENDGGAPSPAGLVRFYDGDPAEGGVVIADVAFSPLGIRERVTTGSWWDTHDLPGSHRIVAVADPEEATPELSEADNRASLELEVAAAPAAVDLTVGAGDLAVSPAEPDFLPAELAITATVRNVGLTDAGLVRVALWRGSPEDGEPLGETQVVLPARSSAAANFVTTLTSPGQTTYTVVLDPAGEVAEADEGNNRASVEVSTRSGLDLGIADSDLALVDGVAYLGNDARFRATVHNRGTLDVASAAIRFSVADDTGSTLVQVASLSLAAGASGTVEVPWRVDRLGPLRLDVVVDPDHRILEGDETNNAASLAFSATELTGANLRIAFDDVTIEPSPGLQGSPVTIRARVHNSGLQELPQVEVAFYDGDPSTGGLATGAVQTIAVPAAGSTEVQVTTPALAGPSDRIYFAVVDPAGLVPELDENDNRAFRDLPVQAYPDLAVSPSAVAVDPERPRPGDVVTVVVDVANQGEQVARDVVVRLSDGTSPGSLEQVVASVSPASLGRATFAWTFPDASGPVVLRIEVDPADEVIELSATNNVAERFVRRADSDLRLSNRYFSPDGDGVKDTTTFYFELAAPTDVAVEVTDELGTARRRRQGPELTGVVQGAFEWDGRDDSGTVVADGEYRIAVVAAGTALAEAVTSVDTNRSALVDAFDTPFQRVTNLTCDVPLLTTSSFVLPYPYDRSYFLSNGVYAMPIGGEPQLLWAGQGGRLVVSDDGEWFASGVGFFAGGGTYGRTRSPSVLSTFPMNTSGHRYGFRPGTHELVIGEQGRLRIIPVDGAGPIRFLPLAQSTFTPNLDSRWFTNSFSPTGSDVILHTTHLSGSGIRPEIADLQTGTSRTLSELVIDETAFPYVWAPNGTYYAFVKDLPIVGEGDDALTRKNRLGSDLAQSDFLTFPKVPMAEIAEFAYLDPPLATTTNAGGLFNRPAISVDSQEVLVMASHGESSAHHNGGYGSLLRFDFRTRQQETVAFTQPTVSHFSYVVSTWDGSAWVERGRLHYGNLYSQQELDLGESLPDANGEYRVRLRQVGEEGAHVEKVMLRIGSGGDRQEQAPTSATMVDGTDVLPLVVRADHEVLDLHEKEVELSWVPADGGEPGPGVVLSLIAREERLSSLVTRPFQYPAGDRGYELALDGAASLVVDGRQTGDDRMGEPLFIELTVPGTGHPTAKVYGYAGSDVENLYAALDFTVDNTVDGERDWAALEVRTPTGWRRFLINVSDGTWGAVGFTYTGRVHHRHKYYEFAIPLAEIGASVGDVIEIRFAAYGTAAEVVEETPFLPSSREVVWIPGSRKALYPSSFGGTYVVDLEDGGRFERILAEFDRLAMPIFVDGGRKLVFRDDRDILDPQHACYNPEGEFSYFMLESLANLSARLEVAPLSDGDGFELRGTAADEHFESYLLEFADEDLPGFWTPIGPPLDEPVIDGVFGPWTPAQAGWYRVRLTVRDLAGNVATDIRRVSYQALGTATISGVAVSPRVISPNGDGIKDGATISYRVLKPVHLEIRIYDSKGGRVRIFLRDHTEPGVTHQLLWDGRNDAGLPVVDGAYRVEVLQHRLTVTIDTRAPTGNIAFLPALDADPGGFIVAEPSLEWCAKDASAATAVLEVGEGSDPQVWSEVAGLSIAKLCPGFRRLDVAATVDRLFRLRIRDVAGNESIATTPPAAPELILHALGPDGTALERLPFSGHLAWPNVVSGLRFAVIETAARPLSAVSVQIRASEVEPWRVFPVDRIYRPGEAVASTSIPDLRFEAASDLALEAGSWQLRLRAVDTSGTEVLSNVAILVQGSGLRVGGWIDGKALAGPHGPDLRHALDRAGLDSEALRLLWAVAEGSSTLYDVSLLLSSQEDPRYAGGTAYLPAAEAGRVYVFVPDDPRACHTYAAVASGRDVATGDLLTSMPLSLRLPCLSLVASLTTDVAACGETPAPGATLRIVPRSLDGEELQLLAVALDDPLDVIHSINAPVAGLTYEVPLDATDIPESYHRLYVRLTNAADEETFEIVPWVVDRTAPELELTFPVEGEAVCATTGGLQGDLTDFGGISEVVVSYWANGGPWRLLSQLGGPATPPSGPLAETPWVGPLAHLAELLASVHGPLELRVEARDHGGNASCASVAFSVDSRHSATLELRPSLLSPNGDGVADGTELGILVQEPATVGVDVFAAEERLVGGVPALVPIGLALASPVVGLPVFDAAVASWAGTKADGTPVTEGRYLARLTSGDACGNLAVVDRGLLVDTTPPFVDLVSPPAGSQVSGVATDLFGTVEDANLAAYQVDVGAGSDPPTWSAIATGTQVRHGELLGRWPTLGLSGRYTLRLRAYDAAGNFSDVHNVVDVTAGGTLLDQLEAVPRVFSPNGDGIFDSTVMRLGLTAAASVTIDVLAADGVLLRSLLDGASTPPGATHVVWDGRDSGGQVVVDGLYHVRVRAEAAGTSHEESLALEVDSTPPVAALTHPAGGFATSSGTVTGAVADPHLEGWRLEHAPSGAPTGWTELAAGTSSVQGPLAAFDGLEDGDHLLRLEAVDAAGNRAETAVSFTVDDLAPRVRFVAPLEGATLGGPASPVAVHVEVTEEHPADYRLEVGPGDAPTSWTALAAGAGLPAPGPIVAWDVAGFADGTYVLRLVASDLAGQATEARVRVTVSTQPPTALLTAPAAGATVAGGLFAIRGTATDTDFQRYELAVGPGAAPADADWMPLGTFVAAVTNNVLMDWGSLPPDGPYTLRLQVFDRGGNVAEARRTFAVDRVPPSRPAGLHTTSIFAGAGIGVDWADNVETDLLGYRLTRNGTPAFTGTITTSGWSDSQLEEGSYTYVVVAVDRAGNASEPSEPVTAILDRTPPLATIQRPRAGARLAGLAEVELTAYSEWDFREYRLLLVVGSVVETIQRSTTAVQSQVVPWDTTGRPDGPVVLRLEAEDVRGHVASQDVAVTLDNSPPAPPTGLAASVSGDDATLTWTANVETDLAGYLLYRDGGLVNASAGVDDMLRLAIPGTTWPDGDLADGQHVYRLAAIDQAGNVSGFSGPVSLTLDIRAPRAVVVQPAAGAKVDADVYVLATCPDLDVASVRLELRAVGETDWTLLGTPTEPPWSAILDPVALGLAYGDLELRATAEDAGGQVDAAPPSVTVTYTDLVRPTAAQSLTLRVDGGTVALTWQANVEDDLAGYHVERRRSDGSLVRLTAEPVEQPSFADSGVADGIYEYAVVAVDLYDNEADPSEAVPASVYAPVLVRPWTPTRELETGLAGTALDAAGAPVTPAAVTLEVRGPLGTSQLAAATDADGRFAFSGVTLGRGANEIDVVVTDTRGDRSKTSLVVVDSAAPLSPPTGLQAVAAYPDAQLSWNPNPEPTTLGYRVLADHLGTEGFGPVGVVASASSERSTFDGAYRALEANNFYWAPLVDATHPSAGQWWAATWTEPRRVSAVEVSFATVANRALDFDLEVWDGGGWLRAVEVRDNGAVTTKVTLAEPYLTTGIRLLFHRIAALDTASVPLRLRLVTFEHLPIVSATAFTDVGVGDGVFEYRVAAVDVHGLEGPPSEPASVVVGDVMPPEPVTLAASVMGADVLLSWEASEAPDLSVYELYRDGTRVATTAATSFVDAGRVNGLYRYVVRVVDVVGNASEPSNEVEVEVALPLPGTPRSLTVTAPAAGRSLAVTWLPPEGETVYAYRLLRATTPGGPYAVAVQQSATSYLDSGLVNGTTYHYVVHVLDPVGNAGPPSGEASGTPANTLVLTVPSPGYPGPAGATRTVKSRQLSRVAGMGQAGHTVALSVDGAEVGTAASLAAAGTDVLPSGLSGSPRPSPDGRWLWFQNSSGTRVVDVETGTNIAVPNAPSTVRWMPSSDRVVYGVSGVSGGPSLVRTYEPATGTVRDLASLRLGTVDSTVVPDPDGNRLLLAGFESPLGTGSYFLDLASGDLTRLSVPGLSVSSAVWSSAGDHLAWTSVIGGSLQILRLADGMVSTAATGLSTGFAWSPSGDAIVYGRFVSSRWQVFLYRLADGTTTQVTTAATTDHRNPRWLPDGSLVYVVNNQIHRRLLTSPSAQSVYSIGLWNPAGVFDASPSGHLFLPASGVYRRVRLPGLFDLQGITLDTGDNVLTLRARDAQGGESAASVPLVVRVVPPDRPDLRIDPGVAVVPAHPVVGVAAAVQLTVRNAGAVASGATQLSLIQIRPDGSTVPLATLPVAALAAGKTVALTGSVVFSGPAALHTLAAVVDPANAVVESSETNNRAELEVGVLGAAAAAIFVATPAEVPAGEVVEIRVEAVNGGTAAFSGDATLVVEDLAGFPVASLPVVGPLALAGGESITAARPWRSGSTFAGTYRVRATLRGAGGSVVAEASAEFELVSAVHLAASVRTDLASYELGDRVRITGTVRELSGASVVPDVAATVRVLDEDGETKAEWRREIGQLLPGSENAWSVDWPTAAAVPGAHRAELVVTSGEDVVASAVAAFDVTGPAVPELEVTKVDALVVDENGDGVAGVGDVLRYEIVVTNDGSGTASEVVLKDRAPTGTRIVGGSLTTDRGDVVSEDPVEIDLDVLAPGETAVVRVDVTIDAASAAGLTEVSNQATLTSAERPAVLSDDPDLGGTTDPTVTPLAALPSLVVEKTVSLSLDADGDGAPSPGDRLAYSIVVRNVGNGDATGVGLLDPTPPHTRPVLGSATTTRGTIEGEGPLAVAIGSLEPGGEVAVTFEVEIDAPLPAGVTEVSNQAVVASDELPEVPSDDPTTPAADPTVTPVSSAPDLTLAKRASLFADHDADGRASPGDEVLYQLEIGNRGAGAATLVRLADPIPAYTSIVSGSVQTSQGTVGAEEPVEVDLGTVAAGGEAVVSFRVRLDDPFPATALAVANQATVTSAQLPPLASDDPETAAALDPTSVEVFVTPDVSVDDVAILESAPEAVFAVALTVPSNRPITLRYDTLSGAAGLGGATAGLDFEAEGGELTVAAGETAAEIAVPLLDDGLDEPDETFSLLLSGAVGASLADGEGIATLLDDDAAPSVSIADVSVVEGDAGASGATFTLALSTPSGFEVAVGWTTADGTARSGEDYEAGGGTVVWPVGTSVATLEVAAIGDEVDERDETFFVVLHDPVHVALAVASAEGEILDDDEAAVSIDDTLVGEEAGVAAFTVRLATTADHEIRVDWTTVEETALAGEDYVAAAGTAVVPAGERTAAIAVEVLDDAILEDEDETFRLELAAPVETTIADRVGIATIVDDELCAGPELLLNGGGEARLVDASIPGWVPVETAWMLRTADPDPAEGGAYLAAGETAATELFQEVDVSAYAERIDEGRQPFAFAALLRTADETPSDLARIVVEYRAASGDVVGAFDTGERTSPEAWEEVEDVRLAPAGVTRIRVRLLASRLAEAGNADAWFDAVSLRSLRAPTITVDDVSVYEGAGTAVFHPRLACAYERELIVGYETLDGSAVAGEDYTAAAGEVRFEVGETDGEVVVPILDDDLDEGGRETFFLELSSVAGADLGVLLDPLAVGEILEDDFCPRSPGYWKNHREEWPIEEVLLGGVWIDDVAMMDLLRAGGSDASTRLAHHTVATLLNLARGSEPSILPVVADAHTFLAAFPPGSAPEGGDRDLANAIKDQLDAYNNRPCQGGSHP